MSKMIQLRVMTTVCSLLLVLGNGNQMVKADFVFGEPERIPNVSRPGAGGPYVTRDGLELYFPCPSADGCSELWVTKRATLEEAWGAPTRVDFPAGSAKPIVDGLCLSADGLEMYFGEGYPGLMYNLKLPCEVDPSGYGMGDLWVSRRTTKESSWGRPENLGPIVNSPDFEGSPSISADGLSLYFTSERPQGYGYLDLYVTTRRSTADPWGPPANLGATINTATVGLYLTSPAESAAFLSPDGRSLYYAVGDLRADIYVSTRATVDGPWGKPMAFGPVNDSLAAEYFLSYATGDSYLYFFRCDAMFDRTTYDVWRIKTSPILDFNGDGKIDGSDLTILDTYWGQDCSLCDVGPLPLGDGIVDQADLRVLMESLVSPSPNASDVPCDAVLSWISPSFAKYHDVYFGTSLEAVSNADRDNPLDAMVSLAQPETTYAPEGLLGFSQTYYWRVDVVAGYSAGEIYHGPVLSFTTEAYAHPIQNITATASGSQVDMGPEKTVDGSGLDANDGHSTDNRDMWQSAGVGPHWIQFEFDEVYALHELWVWNSNQLIEPFLGFGARTVKIEYSIDGTTWTALDGVPEFAKAPGRPGYGADTIISFGGVSAKYVKLTIEKNWGVTQAVGLSEVRFFYIPERLVNQP